MHQHFNPLNNGTFVNKILEKIYHPTAGIYILRWSVALLMLLHGISKLQNGIDGIQGRITSLGLPGFLGYGVLIGEVLAPLFVLSGFFVGPAALVIAFNMVVAIFLVHSGELFSLGKSGGWALELQGLYLLGAVAIALTAKPKN